MEAERLLQNMLVIFQCMQRSMILEHRTVLQVCVTSLLTLKALN